SLRHSGARAVTLLDRYQGWGNHAKSRPNGRLLRKSYSNDPTGALFLVLFLLLFFLALLVDLALGWLGDADGIGPGHRLLQPLLQLPLHRIIRLFVRGRVLHVRIAATLLVRGML